MVKPATQKYGNTAVTSVSISPFFQKLIKDYSISPTECFRRGMAVFLYDLGVPQYQSDKNKERAIFVNEFLKRLERDVDMR